MRCLFRNGPRGKTWDATGGADGYEIGLAATDGTGKKDKEKEKSTGLKTGPHTVKNNGWIDG